MEKSNSFLGWFFGVITLVVLMALLLALPVMWLWNWIMPMLFDLIKINIWQALGINLLCGFLFRTSVSKSN